MTRYTAYHDNCTIHFDSEKELKVYIKNKKRVKVYQHHLVYDRTDKSVKVDRL